MSFSRRKIGQLMGAAVASAGLAAPGRAAGLGAPAETPPPTAPGTVHLPARDIPVPSYLSPVARGYLAAMSAYKPNRTMPAPEDKDAWRAFLNESHQTQLAMMKQMFGGATGATEDLEIAGSRVFSIEPPEWKLPKDAIYFDIHGGGLTGGGGDICRILAGSTARSYGVKVWSVDYRMPPDHPYPAGLDDCLGVYRELLKRYRPDRIIVGGASAGGNLAAATLLRARDEQLPMPAACVLISPELDLTESGDSFRVNDGLDLLTSLMPANLLYADGHSLSEPYLSPVLGDVHGFPPTILTVGSREIFLSNAIRMHRKLRSAEVYAELHVLEVGGHGGLSGRSPEDAAMGLDVQRFLRTALTPAGSRPRALEL